VTLNLLAKLLGRTRAQGPLPPRGDDTTAHVTATITRALDAAGVAPRAQTGVDIRTTIERALAQAGLLKTAPTAADALPTPHAVHHAAAPATGGQWITRSFSNAAGTRQYMLYVPASYAAGADLQVPLIVMLHGCTQSPGDFAAGTRMNALAEAHGFLVAYPAQPPNANGNKCWNWFRAGDQAHGRGEPSLIAGIARHVAADYASIRGACSLPACRRAPRWRSSSAKPIPTCSPRSVRIRVFPSPRHTTSRLPSLR
jgi:hypothetical protein